MATRFLGEMRRRVASDEAMMKLFYLALKNISQKWTFAHPRLAGRLHAIYHPVLGTGSL